MQLSQIDLNLFTVFDAIYREGGITPASKRLHLSQPAVSHALGRLRELLNDPLFERHGNEMIPTPCARALADSIRSSLDGFERTLHRAERFDPATMRRRFTIAMRESREATFLPAILAVLSSEAPYIDVATVRVERRDLEDDLQNGQLDIAVDMALPLSAEIHRERISAEPIVVMARKDHPVVQGSLDMATYLAQEHVLVTGRRTGLGYEDAALQRLNAVRRVRVRCQQYSAASEVVGRSNLLATMPSSFAAHVNRFTGNQVLPFPGDAAALEVFMYWHTNVNDDAAHRWFRELTIKSL